jgi:hypothetical protein
VSMARLWRDQGKRDEARELLAPLLTLVQRRSNWPSISTGMS